MDTNKVIMHPHQVKQLESNNIDAWAMIIAAVMHLDCSSNRIHGLSKSLEGTRRRFLCRRSTTTIVTTSVGGM